MQITVLTQVVDKLFGSWVETKNIVNDNNYAIALGVACLINIEIV